ncbi:hypothetical protein ABDI49_17450 [Bacillus cereus]
MSGCTIVNVKKPNKIVILEKRVDQLNYTNNFGKLIRRIQVELMVGLTTHEIYDSLANEDIGRRIVCMKRLNWLRRDYDDL